MPLSSIQITYQNVWDQNIHVSSIIPATVDVVHAKVMKLLFCNPSHVDYAAEWKNGCEKMKPGCVYKELSDGGTKEGTKTQSQET
ncbi:hypothetical protein CHS0354_024418, partial [Potamilus streckersoni]